MEKWKFFEMGIGTPGSCREYSPLFHMEPFDFRGESALVWTGFFPFKGSFPERQVPFEKGGRVGKLGPGYCSLHEWTGSTYH